MPCVIVYDGYRMSILLVPCHLMCSCLLSPPVIEDKTEGLTISQVKIQKSTSFPFAFSSSYDTRRCKVVVNRSLDVLMLRKPVITSFS